MRLGVCSMRHLHRVPSVVLAVAIALLVAAPAHAAAPVRPDSVTFGPLTFDASNDVTIRVDALGAPTPGRFAHLNIFVSQPGGSVSAKEQFQCTGRPQRFYLETFKYEQGVRPGMRAVTYSSWGTACHLEQRWEPEPDSGMDGLREVTVCENGYEQSYAPEYLESGEAEFLPAMRIDSAKLLRDGSVRFRGTTTCRPDKGEAAPSVFGLSITQGEVTSDDYSFRPRCAGRPSAFDVRLRSTGSAFKPGHASVSGIGNGPLLPWFDENGEVAGHFIYSRVDLTFSVTL